MRFDVYAQQNVRNELSVQTGEKRDEEGALPLTDKCNSVVTEMDIIFMSFFFALRMNLSEDL